MRVGRHKEGGKENSLGNQADHGWVVINPTTSQFEPGQCYSWL